jgi:endonuclease-3
MDQVERAKEIIDRLEEEYPDVQGTSLNWDKPIDILVATILSAQSTDEQINKITEDLFDKYTSAKDYAEADPEELQEDIKSSGFYRRKANWIQSACKTIVENYDGEVPDNMEDLPSLKGVARKTANIVLQNAFDKTVGVAVDTHVKRLSNRLGFSEEDDRNKIEKDLMEVFPEDSWKKVNYLLIAHGREICTAQKPSCSDCVLNDICPSAFTFPHNQDKGSG